MTIISKQNSDKLNEITSSFIKNKSAFLTKITLASLISAFALAGNSQEGVIGSMLVSPLAAPISALIAASLSENLNGAIQSGLFLIIGFAIMIVSGVAVGKIFENEEPTEEMKKRYKHPDEYSAISAVIIGLCFGLVSLSNGSAVSEGVGVGIAISLLPPAVNFGLTLMKKYGRKRKIKNLISTINISLVNVFGLALTTLFCFSSERMT